MDQALKDAYDAINFVIEQTDANFPRRCSCHPLDPCDCVSLDKLPEGIRKAIIAAEELDE